MVVCVSVYGHGSHHIPLCRVARCFMNGLTESRQIMHKCNSLARGSSSQWGGGGGCSFCRWWKSYHNALTNRLKRKRNDTRDECQAESHFHSPPNQSPHSLNEQTKQNTENKRIKLTWCSSIPSHTKALLLSWIVSSTLMTIQYSLQAADERPIHSSICCRPSSPDASLVRGPLQANWKTEAISQRQCLCVGRETCRREMGEKKKEENNWQRMEGARKRESAGGRETFLSSQREQLTCQHLVPCGHIEKAPVGIELTQPKPTLCN